MPNQKKPSKPNKQDGPTQWSQAPRRALDAQIASTDRSIQLSNVVETRAQHALVQAAAVFENAEFHLRVTPDGDSFRVEAPGLAVALGFRESYHLVRSIPDDEKGSTLTGTLGGDQQVWYVTEAGFYRALGQRQTARIKDASVRDMVARFQTWVYGEVIPSIRKTGSYGLVPAQAVSAQLSPRQLAELVIAEADRADAAEARVAALEPAAEAWEELADASGDYSLRDAAHILNRAGIGTGQNRLMAFLRSEHMVDRKSVPYVRYSRYLVERPVSYRHPRTGEQILKQQIRITADGLAYLRKRLGSS